MARTEPADDAPLGSRLLRQYIDATGTTIPAFADREGFARTEIQRLVDGGGAKRVSVAMATRIERATHGVVPIASWLHDAQRGAP